MSDPVLILGFLAAAAVSLGTSWLLVSRLERIGARLGLSEALLGLVAALAADAPEITAAVTALIGHRARIGAGVAVGSNVFNLAALLGLSAVVAGRVDLHRRVIALEGTVAVSLAVVTLLVLSGALVPAGGLAVSILVLGPYVFLLAVGPNGLGRLRLPAAWAKWLSGAVQEEEIELAEAIHPQAGHLSDAVLAAAAVVVVISASVLMEQAASTLGSRHSIPQILTGALLLAGVTSLPNAVAAVYLARRGRGAATLSTTLNSNALNVVIGLMLSGTILGLGAPSAASVLVGAWYLGLTGVTMAAAYRGNGLGRRQGTGIGAAYLVFVIILIAIA